MSEELYELAQHLCGIPEDDGGSEIDEALFDRYDMGMDEFSKLVTDLLPLIDVGKSPLTGKTYKGFAANNTFFVKIEV